MSDRDADLTPAESAEFAALPREREPGRLLEDRTIRELRRRSLLQPRAGRRIGGLVAAAMAAAAAVALFVGGFAVGQWTTSRTLTTSFAAVQQQSAMGAAELVQRTGSAYVTALAALVQLADTSSHPAVAQGREAARTALYAAATELVALVPDDPVAIQMRRLLAGTDSLPARQDDEIRRVVWF